MPEKKRKAFAAQEGCVACGCCVKVCPLGAIQVSKGIMAQVNMEKQAVESSQWQGMT